MTKFILSTATAKVCVLAIAVLVNIINADQINNGRLPAEAVSRIIENYVRPFVNQFKIETHDTRRAGPIEDLTIEKAIEQKIKELKSRLDENTPTDTDNNPQDMEDTKILEFTDKTPKIAIDKSNPVPLNHINKYKKLRRKIEKQLKTEEVSHKTNALVTETLDQMISQMLSSQCTWNRAEENKVFRSNSPQDKKKVMIKSWKSKWQKLIQQYSDASKNTDADGLEYKKMLLFLINLREFFFEIHDELNTQSDRYKVKCQLVGDDKAELPKKFSVVNKRDSLRERPNVAADSDDNCKYIRICSEELKSFMMDFYINLKETVDVTFKNYEEMYKRDVTTADSKEKRSFLTIIKDISGEVNEKVSRSFKKQTKQLKLDVHNNTPAKVDAIKTFLKSTVDLVHKTIGKVLTVHLKSLDSKLRFTVKQDLITTLGIELNNLNKDFSDKICLVFLTCNGNATRRGFNIVQKKGNVDPNDIYIKLNLGFPKAVFRRSGSEIRTLSDETLDRGYNRYQQPSTVKPNFDLRRYMNGTLTVKPKFDLRRYMNVTVTRTTYRVPVKQRTSTATPKKATQCTTKTTSKSIKKQRKTTTTTTKIYTSETTKNTTLTSETTIQAASSTYTYGDYIRKMIAAGKLKKPTTNTDAALTTKQYVKPATKGLGFKDIISKFMY